MRSTDGGQTWTNVYDPGYMGGSGISAIVYDPDTPGLVLAASRQYFGSIMRSTNGGASWTRITAIPPLGASYTWGDWSDLEVSLPNPSAPGGRYYYAAAFTPFGLTFFDAGGLYRSSNDGLTWTRIPLPGEGGNLWSLYGSGFKLATSAVDPNILYVARAADQVIYRGIRNPATDTYSWTEISGPNGAAGSFKRSQNWGQTTYNFAMLCIPQTVNGTTKDALYLSLLSFNGALGVNELSWTPNWVDIGKAYVSGSRTHADNHAIAYSPANPNIIGIGNDGGFYRVTYNPALSASPTEATWQFTYGLNNALVTTQFYQSDFHPTNPNFLLGGTQDNANIYSHGDLTSWRILNGGDGSGSAINPVNPLTQYACNNFLNVNMTRDAWATSRSIAPNYGGDNVPLNGYVGIDPTAPNPLYVGTDYLWRYNPLAGTWNPRLGGQRMALTTTASNGSTSVGIVRCIEVAPQNPNIIYTGTTNGNLWVSFNYGANWKQLASGSYNATDGLPNRAITDIDINPANPNDIIVTLSGTGGGHVYQCANTSAATPTFTNRSGSGGTGLPDAPFESFARDFNAPQTRWYAGSDIGVFMTTDGGATWSDASGPLGMPYVEVSTLKAVPGTGYLMAGTYGRGIWRLPLVDPLPQDNSPANVVLSANAQLVAYNSQSYFYDVHFVMNNTGGTDAQGGAVTTARLNLNGTNYTPQSPTVLPLTFGTIPEGAGAVRRTMRFIVPRQDGVTRTATLFANGQYTANGTVTPFQFSNRITLSPL